MKRSCLVYLGIFFGVGILGGIALVLTIPPAPPGFYTPFLMKLGYSLGGVKAESGAEILSPVVVRRGPAEKARRTLLKQAIIDAIFALVLLAIAAAIVWMFIRKAEGLFY
jgi:hypothetical protein